MIPVDFSSSSLKLRNTDNKISVFDPIRKKWVILTPEEHVRQLLIVHLAGMGYPASKLAVEKTIRVGELGKRYDIVVFGRNHEPWMLVECKAPEITVSEKTLEQLLNYQQVMQCRYWLLTNGRQTYCADANDPKQINWLESLPAYDL